MNSVSVEESVVSQRRLIDQDVENLYTKEEANKKDFYLDKETGMWTHNEFQWEYLEPDVRKLHAELKDRNKLNDPGYKLPTYIAEATEEEPNPVATIEVPEEVPEDVRDPTAVLCGLDTRTQRDAWVEQENKKQQENTQSEETGDLAELTTLLRSVVKDIEEIKSKLDM